MTIPRLIPIVISILITAGLVAIGQARPAKAIKGPVETSVIKVLDGDTFLAEAMIWPGQVLHVKVRIRGIDAPEKRSKCKAERYAAAKASRTLTALLESGPVHISNIGGGKYYGRVLADVTAGNIKSVAAVMLSRSVVRPYRGGRRRSYC